MSLLVQFNDVALDIPVENGWTATKASYSRGGFLARVEFSKDGEKTQGARLDRDKLWFIDRIPMNNYAQRQGEVASLASQINTAIDEDIRDRYAGPKP